MTATLDDILTQAKQQLAASATLADLDQIRVHYLGKKGVFTERMKELGKLSPDERREAGQAINQVRDGFQASLEERKLSLEEQALQARLVSETIDVSLAGTGTGRRRAAPGDTHPAADFQAIHQRRL